MEERLTLVFLSLRRWMLSRVLFYTSPQPRPAEWFFLATCGAQAISEFPCGAGKQKLFYDFPCPQSKALRGPKVCALIANMKLRGLWWQCWAKGGGGVGYCELGCTGGGPHRLFSLAFTSRKRDFLSNAGLVKRSECRGPVRASPDWEPQR